MTDAARPIAEEELHAYVDARLDPGRRAAVERYLDTHPDMAARVGAFAAQREALRSAFADRAAEPIPPALNLARLIEARLDGRTAKPRAGHRQIWRIAAAVLLAFALGGGGGWYLAARPPGEVMALAQEAAVSFAAYAPAGPEASPHWAVRLLNRTIAPPDLSTAGYRLEGSRMVATPQGAAALFLYRDIDDGGRLGVFVRPAANAQDTPIREVSVGRMQGCAWIAGRLGYAVLGAEPYETLLDLSHRVRRQATQPG